MLKRRPFGRTGLEVSELIMGAGYVGGIVIHADDETRRALLRRLLEAGINWIDTAESYGQGASEKALGWLLAELPEADRPYLSTKFRLDTDRLDDIPGQIEKSLSGSLERLGMDRIDLYQLHNPLGQDGFDISHVLGAGGVCDSLDRLKAQGLFDHIGFTSLGDADQCKELISSGRVASAQVYYNLLNPSAGQAVTADWPTTDFGNLIATCQEHGVAVMNIRIFAGGALAAPNPHGREFPITRNSDVPLEHARAETLLASLPPGQGSRAQASVRFGLAHAGISGVVLGLAELSHLEEALEAAAMGPMADDVIAGLQPLWDRGLAEA
ncbi:MAG: aldo/keto reductase [Rhodospirillaceae bacterium]|jgi:D-threo-aldose 1-dehydrogenase|nr:aldo/keto reductase [Rhodospirillaceae bacterium]MBT4487430.1 aldo/keto reductase [Rhodospirillaceae bacterium]MBT5191424.1 aldo/keto reductase [Rhodospirillaceae bacterium]MBT5895077.1 aldo/keto reductase [Rhodospirillaceae bacterium]MBT6427790.1 aldo/keto reductase [Rhodospirillaceae bacterium]